MQSNDDRKTIGMRTADAKKNNVSWQKEVQTPLLSFTPSILSFRWPSKIFCAVFNSHTETGSTAAHSLSTFSLLILGEANDFAWWVCMANVSECQRAYFFSICLFTQAEIQWHTVLCQQHKGNRQKSCTPVRHSWEEIIVCFDPQSLLTYM